MEELLVSMIVENAADLVDNNESWDDDEEIINILNFITDNRGLRDVRNRIEN